MTDHVLFFLFSFSLCCCCLSFWIILCYFFFRYDIGNGRPWDFVLLVSGYFCYYYFLYSYFIYLFFIYFYLFSFFENILKNDSLFKCRPVHIFICRLMFIVESPLYAKIYIYIEKFDRIFNIFLDFFFFSFFSTDLKDFETAVSLYSKSFFVFYTFFYHNINTCRVCCHSLYIHTY